ncbi:MAG: hypothetical protein U9Q74_02495, partial [Gemmatimonadota bacterium]|nr:hypothetical protein [Gemmatimonadota bacterium]
MRGSFLHRLVACAFAAAVLTAASLAAASLAPLAAGAQGRGGQSEPAAPPAGQAQSTAREEYFGPAEEKVSVTQHTMRLHGRDVSYTATVGTIPIRFDNNQVLAR